MKSNVVKMKETKQTTVGLLKGSAGERSEPEGAERSPTVATPTVTIHPDPEVPVQPRRRQFKSSYKLRILRETDAAGPGGIGAILRREGLYSSSLSAWRQQRAKGELDTLSTKKRGPQPLLDESTRRKMTALEKENSRLAQRLKQAEQIIEIQKKISELMGIPLNHSQTGENE